MTNKLNSFTTKTIDLIYIYDLCSPVLFGIENLVRFTRVPGEAKMSAHELDRWALSMKH